MIELTINELRFAIQLKLDDGLVPKYELYYIHSMKVHTVYSFTNAGNPMH